MRRPSWILSILVFLSLLLAGCEAGYTETNSRTSSSQNLRGGSVEARIAKANGASNKGIEVEGGSGLTLEADVTLSVEKGSYRIELLGAGQDDRVTLVLEAHDGETVSGHGQMVVDSFDTATYRVTAVAAENVEYTIVYTFRQ
jgi:hypothetical protein